jgi:hypothetical protein
MNRLGALALLLCLPLVATGCDSKKPPPPAPRQTQPAPRSTPTPKVVAPAGVPDILVARVQTEWPNIEAAGKLFLEKFAAAKAAQASGDRARMDPLIEAAKKHYERALEKWNEIYYSVDDYPEPQAEKCRAFLSPKNRVVDGWTKKAKALKEFSRVQ